jgi:hypothetical protein
MIAYEYSTEVSSNGYLYIPENIKNKINNIKKIKVLIMIEETPIQSQLKISDLLLNSPLKESEIDLSRNDDYGREVLI